MPESGKILKSFQCRRELGSDVKMFPGTPFLFLFFTEVLLIFNIILIYGVSGIVDM